MALSHQAAQQAAKQVARQLVERLAHRLRHVAQCERIGGTFEAADLQQVRLDADTVEEVFEVGRFDGDADQVKVAGWGHAEMLADVRQQPVA